MPKKTTNDSNGSSLTLYGYCIYIHGHSVVTLRGKVYDQVYLIPPLLGARIAAALLRRMTSRRIASADRINRHSTVNSRYNEPRFNEPRDIANSRGGTNDILL